MKWVLAKNVTCDDHGFDQLVTMSDPFGRMILFPSKKEAEEFALEIQDDEPTLVIPEPETL